MARPKKHEHEKLDVSVRLRMTEAERLHVRDQADAAGVTVSDFLRRRALGYQVPRAPHRRRFDPELIVALNAHGNLLNQIARNLHTGRRERLDVEAVLDELRQVLARVTQSVGIDEAEDG